MDDQHDVETAKGDAAAWEVQDTLLQDFQGLVLTFHVAVQNVAPDHAARQLLDHALASADQVITEARQRIEHFDASRSGYSEEHSTTQDNQGESHDNE